MFIQVTYKIRNSGTLCAVLLNVNQIAEVWDDTDGRGGCDIVKMHDAESILHVIESFDEVARLIKEAKQ